MCGKLKVTEGLVLVQERGMYGKMNRELGRYPDGSCHIDKRVAAKTREVIYEQDIGGEIC